ncbi:uncharacterized protein EAF01_002952 [Botrytis porri]|uniref:uncharacterized protein n=1 Tax=Botrytis porri TaxID=87229 RepID=UPI00190118AE|nr:uncharacterized protein EAF01_002952 [Botrytis porri]KAF7911445.1 hypothetical protein EAF01_002952 [Botrytis porri]
MPPKRKLSTFDPPSDTNLTLFLKHTIHTILLLVPPTQTLPQLLTLLLSTLQERYPEGLSPLPSPGNPASKATTTLSSTTTTPTERRIPLPESIKNIALAVPLDPHDLKAGWTELRLGLGDTLESVGVREGGVLAFRFLGEGEEEGEGEFEVAWPSYEIYDEGDEGDEGEEAEERTLAGGEEGL